MQYEKKYEKNFDFFHKKLKYHPYHYQKLKKEQKKLIKTDKTNKNR